jgi:hypothetical protein
MAAWLLVVPFGEGLAKETDPAALEYFSGIRQARSLMQEGSYQAAREMLLGLEKNQRHWEWGWMLEQCAAPGWKVALPLPETPVLHPSPEISAKLLPVAREILEASGSPPSDPPGEVRSPDGKFVARFDAEYRGRPGTTLELFCDASGEKLFSLWTGFYGDAVGPVRFTADGSTLVFLAQSSSPFDPTPSMDVGQELNGETPKGGEMELFFIPVPTAPMVSPERTEKEKLEDPIDRTPWQQAKFDQLPRDIQKAVQSLENYHADHHDSERMKASRRLADWYQTKDGRLLGLFTCFEPEDSDRSGDSAPAAQVLELPGGRVLHSFGVHHGVYPDGGLYFEMGGAFSPDGRMVLVSPSGLGLSGAAEAPRPEEGILGLAAVFPMGEGRVSVLQTGGSYGYARSVKPVWGISPDGRFAFGSSYDDSDPENAISVCRVSDGTTVKGFPRLLGYIGWNPDSSRCYLMALNSSTLVVADPETFKPVAKIPDVVKPSAYYFDDLPIHATPDGSRYTVGRLLFGPDPDQPLLRLDAPPENGLESPLLEALGGKAVEATVAGEALVHWVNHSAGCDSGGSGSTK